MTHVIYMPRVQCKKAKTNEKSSGFDIRKRHCESEIILRVKSKCFMKKLLLFLVEIWELLHCI